jgi:hypothetical protein
MKDVSKKAVCTLHDMAAIFLLEANTDAGKLPSLHQGDFMPRSPNRTVAAGVPDAATVVRQPVRDRQAVDLGRDTRGDGEYPAGIACR